MKLIVGLGNPGREYGETRHNVGFRVVDEIARRHGLAFAMAPSQVPDAFVVKKFGVNPLLLAKPLTFMNRSGDAVSALARYYGIEPADLLVVYDDIDLPFTKLRARARGSAGTHNGMRSVVERLGTTDFPRLRLGSGAGTSGGISPTTCSRSSRRTSSPISKRSSPGRLTPPRCLPRTAS